MAWCTVSRKTWPSVHQMDRMVEVLKADVYIGLTTHFGLFNTGTWIYRLVCVYYELEHEFHVILDWLLYFVIRCELIMRKWFINQVCIRGVSIRLDSCWLEIRSDIFMQIERLFNSQSICMIMCSNKHLLKRSIQMVRIHIGPTLCLVLGNQSLKLIIYGAMREGRRCWWVCIDNRATCVSASLEGHHTSQFHIDTATDLPCTST